MIESVTALGWGLGVGGTLLPFAFLSRFFLGGKSLDEIKTQ